THHALTLPAGSAPGVKGGYIAVLRTYPSEMAQNFWTAIYAWTTCFVVTILVSLATKPRRDEELVGLVYSLTKRPEEGHLAWYQRPAVLGVLVLALTAALNVIFW
ncbi:MAG TPA: Na+/galactose cotransporter, partial [Blastocatellia bacterium]|nr:Na+/galactose cotransporter [Blastocatellia bacterium]